MSAPALELAAVSKDYRGLRPLRVQQLTLGAGQQMAVLGFDEPSAEMMTTIITGAALPDAGTIRVLGFSTADIRNSQEWLQLVDRIGIVTSRAALLDSLSVIQNLSMPFTLEIDPPPPEVRARAAQLADEAGLPEAIANQPVGGLDGELRTRVNLARALSLDPSLLVLEHPTAHVPRQAVPRLASDIRRLAERRGVAALTLTADEAFATGVAARVFIWDPASGVLKEHRRGWRLWGR